MALALCAVSPAWGRVAPTAHQPHPAVVRVMAPESGGASYGSGTLVAIGGAYGLVVTNWHVIRDAGGPVSVIFPDGFRSTARVLRADRDWDLAALSIWRPKVEPVRIARQPPQPGEVLTIAGYGSGSYRAASGRCTQYVSPGGKHPFEMVELSTAARNGDSGGPIFNTQGELAGVLFGAAFGRTSGSYCGRVEQFLGPILADFQRLPENPTMIAGQPAAAGPVQRDPVQRDPIDVVAVRPQPRPTPRYDLAQLPPVEPSETPVAQVSAPPDSPSVLGPTRGEQIKTILAAIGVLALLFHGLRLFGAMQES